MGETSEMKPRESPSRSSTCGCQWTGAPRAILKLVAVTVLLALHRTSPQEHGYAVIAGSLLAAFTIFTLTTGADVRMRPSQPEMAAKTPEMMLLDTMREEFLKT